MTAHEPGTGASDALARAETTAPDPADPPGPDGAATREIMTGPTASRGAATASNPSVSPGANGQTTALAFHPSKSLPETRP